MFNNIGKKIMYSLSDVLGGAGIFLGFIVMAVGCLLAWFSGLGIYGYGKLIDNTEHLSKFRKTIK